MTCGLMLTISLLSHSPSDPAWYFKEIAPRDTENLIGPVGAFLSEAFLQTLGLASLVIAIVLLVTGWNRFWCRPAESKATKLAGFTSVVVTLSGLLALSIGEFPLRGELTPAGGAVGALLAHYLVSALNPAGAFILVVTMLLASVTVATHWSFSATMRQLRGWQRTKTAELLTAFHHRRETRRKEKLRKNVVKKHAKQAQVKQEQERAKPKDKTTVATKKKTPQKQELLPFTPKKGPLDDATPEHSRGPDRRGEGGREGSHGAGEAPAATVSRVQRLGSGAPDPSRPRGHDLRVQTGRWYQVQQDHLARRRICAWRFSRNRCAFPASRESRRWASRSRTRIERLSDSRSSWNRTISSRAPRGSPSLSERPSTARLT